MAGRGEGHILVRGLRNPMKTIELKNTRFEVNELSDGPNSKMEMKEGNVCEVMDSPVEITQLKDGSSYLAKFNVSLLSTKAERKAKWLSTESLA